MAFLVAAPFFERRPLRFRPAAARPLVRQRPLSCSWLSAGDGGELDAEGVEFGDAGVGVREPGGSVAALVIVEVLSHLGVVALACGAAEAETETTEHRVGGLADLRNRDLRFFFPAAAGFGGPKRDVSSL